MFGSYGSYSSTLSSNSSYISQPLDFSYSTSSSNSCAYPSWPRRSSLTESESSMDMRSSSYLSDDDLLFPDTFEDDARSVSSASDGIPTPPAMESPRQHMIDEQELLDMEMRRAAMKREFVRQVVLEKERRRQAAKGKKSANRSCKKSGSPKSKLSSMTPISEV